MLLVSELATNAVLHCTVSEALFKVDIVNDGTHVIIGVSDPDRDHWPDEPRFDLMAEDGRGILLVASYADECGCELLTFTKRVWVKVRIDTGAA